MIKAIAFDFAGVVSGYALRAWFEMHNLDKKIYREITKKWDVGEIDQNEAFRIISKKINIPQHEVYDNIFKPIVFNNEVIKLIKKLKEHYKIALFSDNLSSIVIQQLKDNHLFGLFDYVLISSDHQMTKAQDEYFLKLLSTLNVKASEVVFIDDMKELVNRGNKLGIRSILYTDTTTLVDNLRKLDISL